MASLRSRRSLAAEERNPSLWCRKGLAAVQERHRFGFGNVSLRYRKGLAVEQECGAGKASLRSREDLAVEQAPRCSRASEISLTKLKPKATVPPFGANREADNRQERTLQIQLGHSKDTCSHG